MQDKCHPQTIAVCQTRADGLGLQVEVVKGDAFEFGKDVCGMLVQYPDTHGTVSDYKVSGGFPVIHQILSVWGLRSRSGSRGGTVTQ
jgi:glycine cleavage system pyridoxal-binding protein P